MPNYLISPGSDSDSLSLQIFLGLRVKCLNLNILKRYLYTIRAALR